MDPLPLKEFSIGTMHTISTGVPYENIKVEASLTVSVPDGTTEEEFLKLLVLAEDRLKAVIVETYNTQKRKKRPASPELEREV